jgi:hypothetical protein
MTPTVFDAKEYVRKANEKEQASRQQSTTTVAAPAPAAKTEETASTGKDDDAGTGSHHSSRSQRRLLRQLGEAEGRAKAYEELIKAGLTPAAAKAAAGETVKTDAPTEDKKPERAAFKTDAEFNEAIAAWSGRTEAQKALGRNQELESLRADLNAAAAKAQEDIKGLADWDQVQKEAVQEGPEFVPADHPQLMLLIGKSDVQALVLYHFAKNPDELEKMLDLTKKNPQEQIRLFHRLEGRVEGLYPKAAAADTGKKEEAGQAKPKTAAERDALKHKPSESVAARGGSAPAGTIQPYLEDGKTVNPAWLAKRNERERQR